MVKPTYLLAGSMMDGFKNYQSSTFSTSISGQTLSAGHFASATASVALNNANSVSQVQVQYSGLQTNWNVMFGSINNYFSGGDYEVESFYYFDGTNLKVFTVAANQSFGSVTIPTITINCRAFLFIAPF